jgi:primosomal protein N' (replication factor Y)
MVRVPLSGRRVGGWVVEVDVEAPTGVQLSPIAKVVGHGPSPEVIELCRWVAWRWAGRLATVLRLGSPDRVVAEVPPLRVRPADDRDADELAASVLLTGPGAHVVQVSPVTDPLPIAVAAARLGQVLVVAPGIDTADRLARGLRGAGAAVARWPSDWQAAAGGATVVGGRGAVFAPAPELAAIVVIDEHDETLQNESSPTWHAREVAVERARRAGVPCLLVSPCPSLEALRLQQDDPLLPGRSTPPPSDGSAEPPSDQDAAPLRPGAAPLQPARVDLAAIERLAPVGEVQLPEPHARAARRVERDGWAPLIVVDRRGEDTGRTGLFSSRLVELARATLHDGRRVVAVLNRIGRARLLACRSCGTLAECDRCGAAVHQDDDAQLVCASCGASRPGVCLECGSTALSLLRVGVTRAGEELEALVREPVVVLTGDAAPSASDSARVVVGTEAALHRVHDVGLVAFLDFDQELLAPRYRASEEALALLALASRRVGGRSGGGAVLVQTRRPDHEAVTAALHADPAVVSRVDAARRQLLGFPPAATIASVGGEAAPAYVERVGTAPGLVVHEAGDGQWLLRSREPGLLQDHLATVERPPGRLRLQVDPCRLRVGTP